MDERKRKMKKRYGIMLGLLIGLALVGCKQEEQTPPIEEDPPIVVDELKTQRETALRQLDEYVKDFNIYSTSNQAKIKEILASAKKKVADATKDEEIQTAVTQAKKQVDEIPTVEEETLDKAIADALKELDSYVELESYSEANQKLIQQAITTAKTEIKNSKTSADVASKLIAVKSTIDAITTLVEEVLSEIKISAKKEIEEYKADTSLYSKKGIAEITRIVNDAKENIDSATEVTIVEAIVADAKADLDNVLTAEEEKLAEILKLKESFKGDTDQVLQHISVDGTKILIDTKDQGSSIFHFGNQDNNKYTVFDTKLIADYRSTEHSYFSIRFRAWDTSNGYRLEIHHDHIDIYSSIYDENIGGKVETLIMKNAYGIADKEQVHIQILSHDLKKTVLLNDVCIFTYEEDARLVGHVYFEIWQAGLTLADPMYMEYADSATFLEDWSTLLNQECINESEAEKLNKIKVAAKTELQGFITDTSLYSEANQAVINTILTEGKEAIDLAETKEEIDALVENTKLRLSAVKTIEREQFEADTLAAKKEIEEYLKDLSDYSDTAKTEIAEIIRKGKLKVDAVESVEAIATVVQQVKEELDAVLTIAEENALKASNFKDLFIEDTPTGFIENNIRVEENQVIFDTANLSQTRLHFGIREDSKKWVVLDTRMVVEYQNIETSVLSIRFRAWDESHGYRMDIHNDFIHVYACVWGKADELLLQNKTFGIENGQEVHLQILSAEWKKSVLLNGECIFFIEEDERNVGHIYIETKQVGVTFLTPEYIEYPSEAAFNETYKTLLEIPCINKTERELLEELKVVKKAEIEAHIVDLTLYSEERQKDIADLIVAGKDLIDACKTKDELTQVVIDIKKDLDAVKTIEREAFEADAIAAKEEIENYIPDLSLYSEANQAVITKLIRDAKLDIDACESVEAMQPIVAQAKAALDAVLTLAEESVLRAEAFKDILVEDTADALSNVRLEQNQVVFDTKIANNSTRIRIGAQDGKNHVSFDTKLIVNYNNTEWDDLTIRFRAWDTNDGYKMVIKDSSIVISKCKWGTDDEVVVQKDFGIKNGVEAHLQILCSGWQKTVLLNGEVIFSYNESERTVGYTYIQTWETGVTFIDPVYTEYPDADSFMAEYGELLWKQEG